MQLLDIGVQCLNKLLELFLALGLPFCNQTLTRGQKAQQVDFSAPRPRRHLAQHLFFSSSFSAAFLALPWD